MSEDEREICWECDGTGKCDQCDGAGCDSCIDGSCETCDGTGEEPEDDDNE